MFFKEFSRKGRGFASQLQLLGIHWVSFRHPKLGVAKPKWRGKGHLRVADVCDMCNGHLVRVSMGATDDTGKQVKSEMQKESQEDKLR